MRTAIIIVAFNNADLIIKQAQCISKFYKSEYDIFIIDNSTIPESIAAVRYHAHNSGCCYIKHDNNSASPSISHANACNFGCNGVNKNMYRYILLLDHDNFMVKPMHVSEVLGDKIMAGMLQTRNGINYFWPGCLMWDLSKIGSTAIDFSTDPVKGLDTGGAIHKLILDNGGLQNFVCLNEVHVKNKLFCKSFYDFYSSINEGMFMHFLNASNWANAEANQERLNTLYMILDGKINTTHL